MYKKVGKCGGVWGKMCNFVAEFPITKEQMRFLGNIEARTDAKGRVFLPATFRKVLQASGSEDLVLRKDVFQDCLVLYPESVWNEQMDALRSRLNRYNAHDQQIFRKFVYEVENVTLDGNGRFLISKALLEKAGIQQDVRFIGMGDTIEIWASGRIEETQMSNEAFGQALESIMAQGANPISNILE